MEFDFNLVLDIAPKLLEGLSMTLQLSVLSIVIGGIFGVLLGMFRVSDVLPALQIFVKG